jgi:hypothetical protein
MFMNFRIIIIGSAERISPRHSPPRTCLIHHRVVREEMCAGHMPAIVPPESYGPPRLSEMDLGALTSARLELQP